jgi:hypothetical protein
MKNKKGVEKIMTIYWFVIFFIVAAAIIYMTLAFYGEPYDVRKTEADLLAVQVANCFVEDNFLRSEAITGFGKSFEEECRLNFETEDDYGWGERGQFYVMAEITSYGGGVLSTFESGNGDLLDFCELEGKTLPFCFKRSFYVLGKNQEKYQVNILSVVGKTEKNAQ